MLNISNKEQKKKKIKKHLIRNGMEELMCENWKLVFVFTYLIIIPFILKNAFTLIGMIPDSTPLGFPLIDKITDMILFGTKYGLNILVLVLGILGFFQTIICIGKYHFSIPQDEKFLDTPLVNRQGQPPEYLYKYKDPMKKYGQVLVYDSKGIKKEEFIKEIESMEYVYKKYKVYKVEKYNKDNSLIHIYRIPSKYVKPKVISTKDDWLIDLINMLVVRCYTEQVKVIHYSQYYANWQNT